MCQIYCSSFEMDHILMSPKCLYKINSSDISVLYPYPLFNTIVMLNIVTYKWYLRHGNHNFLWTMSWHSYQDMLLDLFSLLGEDYSFYFFRSYIFYIENMLNTFYHFWCSKRNWLAFDFAFSYIIVIVSITSWISW